jgi:hypothetical protein
MRSSRGKVGVDAREDRHKALSLQECPDKSILLAYTRNQKIENPLKIRLHIEHCQFCRQQCDEYERLNAMLDVLASVQSSLSYHESLAYQVSNVIHGGERQQTKQSGKRINTAPTLSIRAVSIPIALLLAIGALVVVTAVAALALMHAGNKVPIGNTHQVQIGPQSSTAVVSQRHPTPRPKPTSAPASAVSPTPTADPTPLSTPTIALCSTADDLAHSIMRICGRNFTPGDHVVLLIKMPGSSKLKQQPTVVNAQGDFEDSFIIDNCKVPLAISASDLTSPASTNVLQNISFASCPVPTL